MPAGTYRMLWARATCGEAEIGLAVSWSGGPAPDPEKAGVILSRAEKRAATIEGPGEMMS